MLGLLMILFADRNALFRYDLSFFLSSKSDLLFRKGTMTEIEWREQVQDPS